MSADSETRPADWCHEVMRPADGNETAGAYKSGPQPKPLAA